MMPDGGVGSEEMRRSIDLIGDVWLEPSQPQEQPVPVERMEPNPVPPGVNPRVWALVEALAKEQKRIKDGVGSPEGEPT